MSGRGMELTVAIRTVRTVRRDADIVITTMAAAREWMALGSGPLDLVFVPSAMGHATSLGLGLALSQPDRRVIVCNGDGSMLMNLGSLVTIAGSAVPNLAIVLFDNGVYEVTGAQPTPGQGVGVDFASVARGCGFRSVHHFRTNAEWNDSAAKILDGTGPHFISLAVEPVLGKPGPKSPGKAAARAAAFMEALK